MLYAVATEVGHVRIDVVQRHGGYKIKINVHDVDFIQRRVGKCRITLLLEIAEKIPQVQIIFVYGARGVGFDVFVVRKKLPQDRRRIGLIITAHFLIRITEEPRDPAMEVKSAGKGVWMTPDPLERIFTPPKLNKIIILFNYFRIPESPLPYPFFRIRHKIMLHGHANPELRSEWTD